MSSRNGSQYTASLKHEACNENLKGDTRQQESASVQLQVAFDLGTYPSTSTHRTWLSQKQLYVKLLRNVPGPYIILMELMKAFACWRMLSSTCATQGFLSHVVEC